MTLGMRPYDRSKLSHGAGLESKCSMKLWTRMPPGIMTEPYPSVQFESPHPAEVNGRPNTRTQSPRVKSLTTHMNASPTTAPTRMEATKNVYAATS